ncbi:nucleoside deaminase [bacterium]|nr:nucleoside deaminase [bacterium]
MKKVFIVTFAVMFALANNVSAKVISNEKIDAQKVETASKIIADLQKDMQSFTEKGSGPFVAAVYDDKGNLVVKVANSVVNEKCSNNHAEMNAIKAAEQKLGTFDLAPYNLKLYVTAEPCMMCLGGIMWSGIKEVYYGVPSKSVEEITGFDEGFKPHWFKEFKKRGIVVYGNIEPELGEQELTRYVNNGKKIYMPSRESL